MKFTKWNKLKCVLYLHLQTNSKKRTNYIKKKKIFNRFGENSQYIPRTIPSEPYLVRIGKNSRICANVTLITHDIINSMFNNEYGTSLKFHMGTIEIGDNTIICSNSTILYNVKIGNNVIVAAGSVVTSDVPDGLIVGGNPARVIGNSLDLFEKRKITDTLDGLPSNHDDIEAITAFFWND